MPTPSPKQCSNTRRHGPHIHYVDDRPYRCNGRGTNP